MLFWPIQRLALRSMLCRLTQLKDGSLRSIEPKQPSDGVMKLICVLFSLHWAFWISRLFSSSILERGMKLDSPSGYMVMTELSRERTQCDIPGWRIHLDTWRRVSLPQFIVSFLPKAFCPFLGAIWAQRLGEFSHLLSLVLSSHTRFLVWMEEHLCPVQFPFLYQLSDWG